MGSPPFEEKAWGPSGVQSKNTSLPVVSQKERSATGYKRPSLRDENKAVIHVRHDLACLLAYRYARLPDVFLSFGLALTSTSHTRVSR